MRDLTQSGPRTMLKVFGKGSRERLVPVTPSTFRRMRRLGRHLDPDQHLFRTLKRDRTWSDCGPCLTLAGATWSCEDRRPQEDP